MCRNCRSEEVENVEHWLLRCTGTAEEREKLIMTSEGESRVAEYGG